MSGPVSHAIEQELLGELRRQGVVSRSSSTEVQRLLEELGEPGSDEARARFLREHEREARELQARELWRREKRSARDEDAGLFAGAKDGDNEGHPSGLLLETQGAENQP